MAVHVETHTTGDVEVLEFEDPSGGFPPPLSGAAQTRFARDPVSGRLFQSIAGGPYVMVPDLPVASLADVAGGTALPLLTIVPVPWDTARVPVDAVEFGFVAPSPAITILRGGRFLISFNITPIMTAGFGVLARSTVLHALLVNGALAAGVNIVASYHRTAVNGIDTATLEPVILSLVAGDIVSVVSVKISGISTISLLGGGSSLLIERDGG